MHVTQQDLESTRIKVLEITKKIREKKDEKPELSEKAQRIQTVLKSCPFGGTGTEAMARIMTALLDEEITINNTYYWDRRGVVVIPLSNPNGHNYPISMPALLIGNNFMAISLIGTLGNCMPNNLNEDIRIATDVEVEFYFDQLLEIIKNQPNYNFEEHMPIYLTKTDKKARNE